MLKILSPLPDDVEKLMHDTIGCCIAVHRELGPGLLEKSTRARSASSSPLRASSSSARSVYPVQYRGVLLCEQHLDFVVGGQIVLEIKSIDQFAPVHHTQILNYMRVARLRAGLLMNFNVVILPDGMCRKVL